MAWCVGVCVCMNVCMHVLCMLFLLMGLCVVCMSVGEKTWMKHRIDWQYGSYLEYIIIILVSFY